MADVVKGLTHLAVNQACASSILVIRPKLTENAPIIWTKLGRKMGDFLFLVVKQNI